MFVNELGMLTTNPEADTITAIGEAADLLQVASRQAHGLLAAEVLLTELQACAIEKRALTAESLEEALKTGSDTVIEGANDNLFGKGDSLGSATRLAVRSLEAVASKKAPDLDKVVIELDPKQAWRTELLGAAAIVKELCCSAMIHSNPDMSVIMDSLAARGLSGNNPYDNLSNYIRIVNRSAVIEQVIAENAANSITSILDSEAGEASFTDYLESHDAAA